MCAALLMGLAACTTYDNFINALRGEDETVIPETIKIGIFEPVTGEYSEKAAEEIKGIELAHQYFPTVLEKNIELIYADNQSDPIYAAEAAQSLIDAGCSVVIGSYGNILTLAGCDVFEPMHTVCIGATCTNPLITGTTEYYFRVCVIDAFQGNSAAKFVTEYLPGVLNVDDPETEEIEGGGPVSCVILKKADDDYASSMIERFQSKLSELYGSAGIASVIEYPEGEEEMLSYLSRISDIGGQAVFFPSTSAEGERVMYQAHEYGFDFKWIGNSEWSDLIAAADSAKRADYSHLEGASFVAEFDSGADSKTPMTEIFVSAANTVYGEENPSENMALGFDAYLLALEGIRTAETYNSPYSVRLALLKVFEMEGATGKITLKNGTGDPIKDIVIETIKDGQVVPEFTAAPVWN